VGKYDIIIVLFGPGDIKERRAISDATVESTAMPDKPMKWIRWFRDTGIDDVALVGGKNASLGEMLRELADLGVRIPDGFAITAAGYRRFLTANALAGEIAEILSDLDRSDVTDLAHRSRRIRNLILAGSFPDELIEEIGAAYEELSRRAEVDDAFVAVRSSATAEDLPTASFAGQQESFLMVHGQAELLQTVKRAFASLFTARAVSYREDLGFAHLDVALSVGVQQMVRSDHAAAGVIFTLDTETGFPDVIAVTSSWGLGENIVQGKVTPDEFIVHKPKLREGFAAIVARRCGDKELTLGFLELVHAEHRRAEARLSASYRPTG
jgi:pyruvate,water dikinase